MRSNVDLLRIVALASLALCATARSQSIDPRIAEAQGEFEREFLKDVRVIQDQYRKALEGHLTNFTRLGDLDSAKETSAELKAAKSWHSIPRVYGELRFQNEPLQVLRQHYETALEKAISPIVARQVQRLDALKRSLTQSGNLRDATVIDEELKRLERGESTPIDAAARMHFSGFDKNEFAEWLTEITVQFTGVFAGETFITFDGKEMTYLSKSMPLQYGYRVVGPRIVEVDHGGWRLEFSKDLHSGTFHTKDNSYEAQVRFERSQDSEGVSAP